MKTALVTTSADVFALPVTVMLRSVVDHLSGTGCLDVYVLDCGLTAASRRKMRCSVSRSWVSLHFIPIEPDRLRGFPVDARLSTPTYARLLMGECLPADLERVLYLDGDMLMLWDIRELLEMDFKGHSLAAVQDPVAGRVGQSAQMMHWEGWDVPSGTPVFNAGLLVVDLPRWRSEKIFDRAMQVLKEHPARLPFLDQDALNYVIRGDYLSLDPSWNVLPFLNYLPHSEDVIYAKEITDRCVADPKGIHYGGTWRPWKGPGRHWKEAEFYRYLYRTAWRNDVYCAPWMGRGNTSFTRFKRLLKSGLRFRKDIAEGPPGGVT